MADNVPGEPTPKTLYKMTQKLSDGSILCKVFAPGSAIGTADLFVGVSPGMTKTVDVTCIQLVTTSVNLDEFFKTGGALFSQADIK